MFSDSSKNGWFSRLLVLALTLMCLPVGLIIGLLVFFSDGLPVFFVSERIGTGNIPFKIYKFRTMKVGAPLLSTADMPRNHGYYIFFGRTLRRYSLDELPQLWNVLIGDMALVGPRPCLPTEAKLIAMRNQAQISLMKPGISGLAQISGGDSLSLDEKVALEKFYARNKSLCLDIKIILLTMMLVLGVNVRAWVK